MSKCAIPVQVGTSTNLHRTNSLKQFDYASILGVPNSVGMVPLIYQIKLSSCGGMRGVVFYGNSYDDLCFMYPQIEHEENCIRGFLYKFDGLECIYNEEIDETRFKRHKGLGEILVENKRKYWNGTLIYKADYKLKACDSGECCHNYPMDDDNDSATVVEKPNVRKEKVVTTAQPTAKVTGCQTCGRRK